MYKIIAITIGCLILAACSGAPISFYTLRPDTHFNAQHAVNHHYYVSVLPVRIPASVDQPEMLVRESDSAVKLMETSRWIAPIDDEIKASLSATLSRELGVGDMYGQGIKTDKPVYQVALEITDFESRPGAYARIAGDWHIHQKGHQETFASCTAKIDKDLDDASFDTLVKGYQEALATLNERIATSVKNFSQGHQDHCY